MWFVAIWHLFISLHVAFIQNELLLFHFFLFCREWLWIENSLALEKSVFIVNSGEHWALQMMFARPVFTALAVRFEGKLTAKWETRLPEASATMTEEPSLMYLMSQQQSIVWRCTCLTLCRQTPSVCSHWAVQQEKNLAARVCHGPSQRSRSPQEFSFQGKTLGFTSVSVCQTTCGDRTLLIQNTRG